MSEEKIIPPDEKQWVELENLREDKFLDKLIFYRIRIYGHAQKLSEVLLTMEFLGMGVVLKCRAIAFEDRVDKYFYLLLSDDRWVEGLINAVYKLDADDEIREDGKFIRLIITLQTAHGTCRRILRKKI